MPAGSSKRLKLSKYIPVSAATIFLVGATTLFFAFPCPWLSRSFSLVIPVYNGIVFLFVLANFSMATFMDPGIFPRAEEDEDKEDDFRAPLYKTVEIKGIQVRMKWCSTCRFYRPPRCSHCSVCDNCVEEFDHHCPWVNNCIGRRNYRYFFLFLVSLTLHIINVFGFGLVYVLYHVEELSKVHAAVTMAVMCVAGLFFVPVAGLTGFHMVLVARGRTTNEQVTGKFRGGVNPFTNGCWRNVSHVLCSSPAPRYLGRARKEQTVLVRPPFLRPEASDGQITVKIMDNGIQSELKRSKSRESLELTESQSADAEPPPPPKPDLSRYTGLRPPLSLPTNEESGLARDSPPTPTMYKYRPGYSSNSTSGAMPHSTSAKEREKLLSQSPSPPPLAREEEHVLADSGIQSTPSSGHVTRFSSSSDDSKRSPLAKNPLTRPAPPRFGKPLDSGQGSSSFYGLRGRSLGSPEHQSAPYGSNLGKSVPYSNQRGPHLSGPPDTEEVALQPLLPPKDEIQLKTSHSKSNGQPKTLGPSSSPSPPPLSPTRGAGGVKKVSGVGGTTYEISV
ncbi:palmitoyltransferase ZDHHC5 isoform X2 [Rhinatrema bivittatum]|uniref:palmitoyltransferase ZDHHC5 isoform X2 n=1 Tax=Rhinatrema bivittatum TaxID=194408 RepID=UPI00112EC2C2|nr:palmitoyltransferase ZDHHC5 isoform X2 [Rhinatrema bivittatum]